ncbi:hypothetical protein J4206_02095 [Candidatus Woesearchaeota archaeon]|nr:hypothetical protein [Candidatus Woesearchaeota archaeon]
MDKNIKSMTNASSIACKSYSQIAALQIEYPKKDRQKLTKCPSQKRKNKSNERR